MKKIFFIHTIEICLVAILVNGCKSTSYTSIELNNDYTLNIPSKFYKYPMVYIPRELDTPKGIVYTYYEIKKDMFNTMKGIVISNYCNAMEQYAQTDVEYWVEYERTAHTLQSDTLFFEGYHQSSLQRNGYWKIMIIRNPIIDTKGNCFLVGYYGIRKNEIKSFEEIFKTTTDTVPFLFHKDGEPLFDSVIMRRWQQDLF